MKQVFYENIGNSLIFVAATLNLSCWRDFLCVCGSEFLNEVHLDPELDFGFALRGVGGRNGHVGSRDDDDAMNLVT